jgi:hypothetical protein
LSRRLVSSKPCGDGRLGEGESSPRRAEASEGGSSSKQKLVADGLRPPPFSLRKKPQKTKEKRRKPKKSPERGCPHFEPANACRAVGLAKADPLFEKNSHQKSSKTFKKPQKTPSRPGRIHRNSEIDEYWCPPLKFEI